MGAKPVGINGINGSTGGYLLPGATAGEIASMARGVPVEVDPGHFATLKKWWGRLSGKFFDVQQGIDSRDLAEAGWGVIFPFAGDAAAKARQQGIIEALRPLFDLRRAQAGRVQESFYRELTGPDAYRPGESKRDFLIRHKASPGSPADPKKLPYYLLIVADSEEIPYRFQYQIDVEYAVGRLHFETVDEYARYAQSVVEAETGGATRPRTARLFGVRNDDDGATQLSADHLIRPMAEILREQLARATSPAESWDLGTVLAQEATKARLSGLLGGAETPAFLMTASHGMGFNNDDPRQLAHQGALLCQDWPGPLAARSNQPIDPGCYFAADDLGDSARLGGLIAFFFACYGAGTPQLDDFPDLSLGSRDQIAPHSFLARLPQRMLGHPNGGALAVVGHVERAWGYSFQWPGAGEQLGAFQGMLVRLLSGYPIGAATEFLNQRHAALSVELGEALAEEKFGRAIDDDNLAGLWISNNDARSYVILGDPAVRVAGSAVSDFSGFQPGAWSSVSSVGSTPPVPAESEPRGTDAGPASFRAVDPFADVPVIGRMTATDAAARLRSVGDEDAARALEGQGPAGPSVSPAPVAFGPLGQLFGRSPQPWEHTAHSFGFLAAGPSVAGQVQPIQNASAISPDPTLKGASVKITLDDMRVAAYPGGGMHRVLIDFSAQNQASGKVEDLHFSATVRVQDGQQAGFVGQPVFVGLNVGFEGITLRCYTVNVRNDIDQAFLDTLESDTFKSGLQLLSAAQPALGPLSGLAAGVTRAIAARHQNIPVQDVILGLDFSTIRTRARLAEGSYLAVQIPDASAVTWDWSAWVFNPSSGRVVAKDDPTKPIPYNYFIFSISRCEPAPAPPASA